MGERYRGAKGENKGANGGQRKGIEGIEKRKGEEGRESGGNPTSPCPDKLLLSFLVKQYLC